MSYVERRAPRPGANDPCHCGSGRKYKKCHRDADAQADRDSAPVRIVAGGRVVGLTGEAARAYRALPEHERVMVLGDVGQQAEAHAETARAEAAARGEELRQVPPLPVPDVGVAAPALIPAAVPELARERQIVAILTWPARAVRRAWWAIRSGLWWVRVNVHRAWTEARARRAKRKG